MDSKISIPRLFYDGTYHPINGYRFFVMELLGENLSDLQKRCGGSFTLPTVCMIASQTIARFEELHEQGVVTNLEFFKILYNATALSIILWKLCSYVKKSLFYLISMSGFEISCV